MKAFNRAHDFFFRGLESIMAEQRHGSGRDHWEFTSHEQEGERALGWHMSFETSELLLSVTSLSRSYFLNRSYQLGLNI